ncbi:MAG: type II toxin-antitoxin system prevent-host-death family antitoxin [Sedimenticola sp.]
MQTINIHEAKTHLSRFVDKAAAGEEVIIARAGKPIARLVPLLKDEHKPRTLGLGKGKFSLPDNFSTLHEETIRQMFEDGE